MVLGKYNYYVGIVVMAFGFANVAPLVVALAYGEWLWMQYTIASVLMIVSGLFLLRRGELEELRIYEAALIAVFSFVLPALVNAVIMISAGFDVWDSLFESVSGITTTGLSVFSSGELPVTFVFARAWLQWLGGLGIVIITLAFLLRPGTASHRLFAIHLKKDTDLPSVKVVAKGIATIYAGLTVFFFASYMIAGASFFDSLVHALTTVSTGGFSTDKGLPSQIVLLSMFFMFVSAQSFTIYFRMWKSRSMRALIHSPQIRVFIMVNLLAIIAGMVATHAWSDGISAIDVAYQVVSASTTTGYSTISMDSLNDGIRFTLIVLMLIGASMGSTGGGFKQFRLIVVMKSLKRAVARFISPEGTVHIVKVGGVPLDDEEVSAHVAVVLVYVLVLALSALAFMVAGYGMSDSLFATSSALGTVGLQPGIIGHSLQWWLKLVLVLDMLLGRLEVITVFVAVATLLRRH